MTIARIKDSSTTPITDGTTYDPAVSGSDQGVDSLMLYRDSTGGSTSSDFQLNSVNFVQDQSILEASLLSFTMFLTSGSIVQSAIPASGTFDAQISGTATGEGGIVSTISGMLQTGTITSDMQLSTFATAAMPTQSVSAVAGDKITMLYESNGGTDSLPSNLSTGDVWSERASGALTGSPLSQGKIWDVLVTGTISSESIGGSDILTGSNSGSLGTKVTKGSVGGGPTTTPKSTTYTATGASSLATATTLLIQPNMSATGALSLIKLVSKFFGMSAVGSSTIQKTVGKIININSIGTASQQEGLVMDQAGNQTAIGTLTTATNLIIGIGGTIKRIARAIVRNIVRNIVQLIGK